jgi:low affinity Fe/Cu permease
MGLIKIYIDLNFWQILLFGGAIVAALLIVFMIISFVIALVSNYGRLFAFSHSTFVTFIYGYAVILYFPIKLILKLKYLKETIKKLATT